MADTKVTWRGRASLDAVRAALVQHGRAEILLPADCHHALWRTLGSSAPGAPETLDVVGDLALLRGVAGIESLVELGLVADSLAGLQAEVRVASPSPVIRIRLPGDRTRPAS